MLEFGIRNKHCTFAPFFSISIKLSKCFSAPLSLLNPVYITSYLEFLHSFLHMYFMTCILNLAQHYAEMFLGGLHCILLVWSMNVRSSCIYGQVVVEQIGHSDNRCFWKKGHPTCKLYQTKLLTLQPGCNILTFTQCMKFAFKAP